MARIIKGIGEASRLAASLAKGIQLVNKIDKYNPCQATYRAGVAAAGKVGGKVGEAIVQYVPSMKQPHRGKTGSRGVGLLDAPQKKRHVRNAKRSAGQGAPVGRRSGLRALERQDIRVREVQDRFGYRVTIHGQAESRTSHLGAGGQADVIERLAVELAATGDYEYITEQLSWASATGRVADVGWEPDVIGVRRDGRVDAWEVRSPGQTRGQPARTLRINLEQGMAALPLERQGRTQVIELQEGRYVIELGDGRQIVIGPGQGP